MFREKLPKENKPHLQYHNNYWWVSKTFNGKLYWQGITKWNNPFWIPRMDFLKKPYENSANN